MWSVRALVKLNRLVEAVERYQELQRLAYSGGDVEVQRRAKQDAAAEQEALAQRIPSLVVRLENAGADWVCFAFESNPTAPPGRLRT